MTLDRIKAEAEFFGIRSMLEEIEKKETEKVEKPKEKELIIVVIYGASYSVRHLLLKYDENRLSLGSILPDYPIFLHTATGDNAQDYTFDDVPRREVLFRSNANSGLPLLEIRARLLADWDAFFKRDKARIVGTGIA